MKNKDLIVFSADKKKNNGADYGKMKVIKHFFKFTFPVSLDSHDPVDLDVIPEANRKEFIFISRIDRYFSIRIAGRLG